MVDAGGEGEAVAMAARPKKIMRAVIVQGLVFSLVINQGHTAEERCHVLTRHLQRRWEAI